MPLLDQAALDAVRQWIYTPTTLNGVAVPVVMTVTVRFSAAAVRSIMRPHSQLNVTPMIDGVLDAAKGAGVDRVGVVTERMRGMPKR